MKRHYRAQELGWSLAEYDDTEAGDAEDAWCVHIARAAQRAKQEAKNPLLGLLAGLLGWR